MSGKDLWWGDVREFGFATDDGALGLFVRLSLYPNLKQAWFWAGVARNNRPYVLCREHDIRPPSPPWPLEIRGGALWAHLICETPGRHWTVAMEAFAVGFDDPGVAWRDERGDRVGLAFDLEWENVEEPSPFSGERSDGFDVDCRVTGELQLDDEVYHVDGAGYRWRARGLADVAHLGGVGPTKTQPAQSSYLTAPLQIESPPGPSKRFERSLRRTASNSWRWDLTLC